MKSLIKNSAYLLGAGLFLFGVDCVDYSIENSKCKPYLKSLEINSINHSKKVLEFISKEKLELEVK